MPRRFATGDIVRLTLAGKFKLAEAGGGFSEGPFTVQQYLRRSPFGWVVRIAGSDGTADDVMEWHLATYAIPVNRRVLDNGRKP